MVPHVLIESEEGKSDPDVRDHHPESESAFELSETTSHSDEPSDTGREGEEDFGIPKALATRTAATSRKGKNVAAQLQQGVRA